MGDPFQSHGSPEPTVDQSALEGCGTDALGVFLALPLEKSFKLFLPQLPSLIKEEKWYHLFLKVIGLLLVKSYITFDLFSEDQIYGGLCTYSIRKKYVCSICKNANTLRTTHANFLQK